MKTNKKNIITMLFTTTLFIIFASVALTVVFVGANTYASIVRRLDQSFELDTTLIYLSTQINQTDLATLATTPERTSLVLTNIRPQDIFQTWIFHDNGLLTEQFLRVDWASAHLPIDPLNEIGIIGLHDFEMVAIHDQLAQFTVRDAAGNENQLFKQMNTLTLTVR